MSVNMVIANGNIWASAASPKCGDVILVHWDPNSTQHAQRHYDQRIACGWKQERIEFWRALQREGKMAIHWVVGNSVVSPNQKTNPAAFLDGAR